MRVFGTVIQAPRTWDGVGTLHHQARIIVAARSRAAAIRAFHAVGLTSVTAGHMAAYGSETWNPVELEIANSEPGAVFYRGLTDRGGSYSRVPAP